MFVTHIFPINFSYGVLTFSYEFLLEKPCNSPCVRDHNEAEVPYQALLQLPQN